MRQAGRGGPWAPVTPSGWLLRAATCTEAGLEPAGLIRLLGAAQRDPVVLELGRRAASAVPRTDGDEATFLEAVCPPCRKLSLVEADLE